MVWEGRFGGCRLVPEKEHKLGGVGRAYQAPESIYREIGRMAGRSMVLQSAVV